MSKFMGSVTGYINQLEAELGEGKDTLARLQRAYDRLVADNEKCRGELRDAHASIRALMQERALKGEAS